MSPQNNSYATSFQETFDGLKKDEEAKDLLCRQTFLTSIAAFSTFVESRKESIVAAGEGLAGVVGDKILADRSDWVRKIERKIRKKNEEVEKRMQGVGSGGAGGEEKEGNGEKKQEQEQGQRQEQEQEQEQDEDDDREEGFDVKVRLVKNRTIYKLLSEATQYTPDDLPEGECEQSTRCCLFSVLFSLRVQLCLERSFFTLFLLLS